ncbi:hypothetical protein B0H11DRAFT_2013750 [Mycena galericulata]|nr:hypothetical protein B0H11DRAFT_2013750 [Mycena galericulata]
MSPVALFVLWFPFVANAFSFTSTAPTECDDFKISWTGGSGSGYYLYLQPTFDVGRNISIPSSSNGTFSTTMPFKQNYQFVATLSDSTGFGAGGSTGLLSVGKSLGGSCNTTSPGLAFSFSLPVAPQQCQPYEFTDYIESGARAPVTIYGVIPGGDSFILNPPSGPKTYNWVADVFNGTQIVFSMVDSSFQQGGSFLATVEPSGDSSCINSTSPSSTIDLSASPTSTTSPSSSSTPTPASSSTGAIAGSVMGAIILLAVLITLGLFFLRQRQEKIKARMAGGSEFRRTSNTHPYMSPSNLVTPSSTSSLFTNMQSQPPAHYQPHSPYLTSRLPESENPFAEPSSNPDVDPFVQRAPSDGVTSGQRKSAMSGLTSYTPSRFIVHTDAEDDLPADEDGVVQLPPQYSATRPPARGIPSTESFHPPPP